jgi:hypothetical protein
VAVIGAEAFDPPPLLPLQTTRVDFFSGGTLAGSLHEPMASPATCALCHNNTNAPSNLWPATMMAQSARDPIFWAAFSIAQQDAAFIGDFCLRCHVPAAWADGRVAEPHPTDGSAIYNTELNGVSCIACHRMVDPDYTPGIDPPSDALILAGIAGSGHLWPHNANMVLDPDDVRRGPLNLDADWPGGWPGYHQYARSPFHSDSRLCATCHDVSTPTYTLDTNTGAYVPNALNAPPPVNKYHQFPEQRTYSEWTVSLFAAGGVNLGGRFGGARGPVVSSCQDCHMPGRANSRNCTANPPVRTIPLHEFNGSNSWVLRAVDGLIPRALTLLTQNSVNTSVSRNAQLMRDASDMELSVVDDELNVRVINYSGHKLPTGYAEGRRMWINVRFLAANGALLAERGAYNTATAQFHGDDTKVYEAVHGLDATAAALTGEPEGHAFRLALVNVILKDNRIPPMGFNNAMAEAVQAGSVPPGLYADGQYWDDTRYAVPVGAARAVVTVYHQTTTKEYIEFLRDQDQRAFPIDPQTQERIFPELLLEGIPAQFDSPRANTFGQLAYNLWNFYGKSAPVAMDTGSIVVGCLTDWNADGVSDVPDIFAFLVSWFNGQGDFDQNGSTQVADIILFLTHWFNGCG